MNMNTEKTNNMTDNFIDLIIQNIPKRLLGTVS